MRRALLAGVLALAAASAWADNITLTATVDGVLIDTITSSDGTLNPANVSFGPDYNLNSLNIDSETFLAPPGIIHTNTINVDQNVSGSHQLVLDIKADGLVGPGAVTALLSEFSVTGLTGGWSAMEQTFINGNPLASTPLFTANSASADVGGSANLTNPFEAEVRYTINSDSVGQFNGGINIDAVPGPVLGAGFPCMLAGMIMLGLVRARRRRGE